MTPILQNPITFIIVAIVARFIPQSGFTFYLIASVFSIILISYIDLSSILLIFTGILILISVEKGLKTINAIIMCIIILIIYKSGFLIYLGYLLNSELFNQIFIGTDRYKNEIPSGASFFLLTICTLVANKSIRNKLLESISTSTFFPHILAGPVLYKGLVIKKRLTISGPGYASIMFCFGMYLLYSSEILNQIHKSVEVSIESNGYFKSWIFYLYLYSNFFGYSLLATAYAMLFGIEIPINFNAPSIAKSPSDFWKRWHRSLSLLFRNYVYKWFILKGIKPITGIFIIMCLSGLWHGWAVNFILWGIINGILIILFWKKTDNFFFRVMTFIIMPATWVPFYSNNISTILEDYNKFLLFHISYESISIKYFIILISVLIISCIPYSKLFGIIYNISYNSTEPYGVHKLKYSNTWREKMISIIGGSLLALILFYSIGSTSDFIYQRF